MDIKQKLIDVLKNNPDLPIECQVAQECYTDDFYWGMGKLLGVEVMTIYKLEDCTILDTDGLKDHLDCQGYEGVEFDAKYDEITATGIKVIMLTIGV